MSQSTNPLLLHSASPSMINNTGNSQNQISSYYATTKPDQILPDGFLLGTTPDGTPVYSNSFAIGKRNTPLFEQTGDGKSIKFECVQLSRLWLWNFYGVLLPSITLAAQIFYLPFVYNENEEKVPLRAIRNGGHEKPVKNSIIIYAAHPGNLTGHIGVIVEVSDSQVFVACQNRYSRKFKDGAYWNDSYPLKFDNETLCWTVGDTEPVIGWMLPMFGTSNTSNSESATSSLSKTFQQHRNQIQRQELQLFIGAGETIKPMRPFPQRFLDGEFPEYESQVTRSAWGAVFAEFLPSSAWFPDYFTVLSQQMLRLSGSLNSLFKFVDVDEN